MWSNNSILNHPTPHTSCQEIFQAVCDEIGRHYQEKGFKYAQSRPKISYRDKVLKVDIAFWSSRSNIPGDYVNFTIIPSFYSLAVKKKGLSTIASKQVQGLILSNTALFSEKASPGEKQAKLVQIFGEVIPTDKPPSEIHYNNSCNVYKLDQVKFQQILDFLDARIIPWIEKVKTPEGVEELIARATKSGLKSLLGKSINSDFVPYCQDAFPDLDIKHKLKA